MLAIDSPFNQYFELAGDPLDAGAVYIGAPNLDPVTNPLPVFWDYAGTIPAAQPVPTRNGYLSRAGAPALLYTAADYSVTAKNRRGEIVYTLRSSAEFGGAGQILTRLADPSTPENGFGMLGYDPGTPYTTGAGKFFNVVFGRTPAEIAASVVPTNYAYAPGNVFRYGAKGDASTNDSAAFQAAFDVCRFGGGEAYAPSATYRIGSLLRYITTSTQVFTPGLRLRGDGMGKTVLVNATGGVMITVDSDTLLKFHLGGELKGFTVDDASGQVGNIGISIRKTYHYVLGDLNIKRQALDGLQLICVNGDSDGPNNVELTQVRIENCGRWGIQCVMGAGNNELSFLSLSHVFIQQCGTGSVGGGIYWRGQMLLMDNVAFTLNTPRAIYIEGGAGLGSNVSLRNVTCENSYIGHIVVYGIQGFEADNLQMYSNDLYVVAIGCNFISTGSVLRNINIRSAKVRATAGNNPYTAFKLSGPGINPNSIRVRNVIWDNFDYAGQTRFDGIYFDAVPQECKLVVSASTLVSFVPGERGNKTPYRLRGGVGGVPSTTGEWVEWQIAPGGVSITNSGLAASTRYYVYLYDNVGFNALSLSTSAPTTDAISGHQVDPADPARLYVGSVLTDAGSLFATSGTGWLNPTQISGGQVGVPSYQWYSSTSSAYRRTIAALPTSDTDGALV